MPVQVKVCGVRTFEDAAACVDLGVDALGLNFWPGTPRRIELEVARRIVAAFADQVELVGVFVDAPLDEVRARREAIGFAWAQLHGDESPADVEALLPFAYKACGIAEAADVAAARRFPGERLLLDARVPGAMPGGTGTRFDWALAGDIARERSLTLAGGLGPDNVAEAIAAVRPARVDVASGVESRPGVKDLDLVAAFVQAARRVL